MSSRRKVRSSQSMYHPGISLSHGISYNQRKGMILTRDTNLPHAPTKVFTSQSMRQEAKRVLSSGRVGFQSVFIDINVPLGGQNSFSIDSPDLVNAVRDKLGWSKILYSVWVNSFSVLNTKSQPWPDISYVLHIDDETYTVTCSSGTSTTGLNQLSYADFATPNAYPIYTSQVIVSLPRFFRATTTNNYGEVHDTTSATASQGAAALVRSAVDKGYGIIPFLNAGSTYPYPTNTVITFDTTGLTQEIVLRVYFNVLYYK